MSPITVVRDRLGDHAHGRIAALIIDGTFGPGHRLRDVDIADELGVSRQPVREALLRLEREGLVEISASRATTVAEITEDDLLQVARFVPAQLRVLSEDALTGPHASAVIARLAEASGLATYDTGARASVVDAQWALVGLTVGAGEQTLAERMFEMMDPFVRWTARRLPRAAAGLHDLLEDLRAHAHAGDAAAVLDDIRTLCDIRSSVAVQTRVSRADRMSG